MASKALSRARLRFLLVLFGVGLIYLGCSSASNPIPAPSEPAVLNVAGTWTGSASDSSGPGSMTWIVSQSGTALTGTVTATDTTTNLNGRGSLTGTVSSSSIHFTITVPAGGVDAPFADCTADISGDAQVSSASMTGTYSGVNSCMGAITAGQIGLTRPG